MRLTNDEIESLTELDELKRRPEYWTCEIYEDQRLAFKALLREVRDLTPHLLEPAPDPKHHCEGSDAGRENMEIHRKDHHWQMWTWDEAAVIKYCPFCGEELT